MLIINKIRKPGRPRNNPTPVEQVGGSEPSKKSVKVVDKKKAILTLLHGELARHAEGVARQAEDRALRQEVRLGTSQGRCYTCGCHLSPDDAYHVSGKEYCNECVEPEEISF